MPIFKFKNTRVSLNKSRETGETSAEWISCNYTTQTLTPVYELLAWSGLFMLLPLDTNERNSFPYSTTNILKKVATGNPLAETYRSARPVDAALLISSSGGEEKGKQKKYI